MNITRVERGLKAFAFLGFLVLAIIYLPRPTLTIAVHQGVEGVPLKQVAQQFCQKVYRGDIKVVELDYDELYEAEWSAVAGRGASYPFESYPRFDVIMLDDPWLPALAASNQLRPLDVAALTGNNVQDFPPASLKACQVASAYYALPFTGNSQLFCRATRKGAPKTALPANWKQLLEPGFAEAGRVPYAMRLRPGNSIATDFFPILWEFAPKSFTEQDYLNLDPKQSAAALETFRRLAATQNWAGAVTQDVDVAVSLALGSASSGIVWSSWAMALERLEDQVGAASGAQLEFGWFGDESSKPLLGNWLLAVPSNSPHPQQAEQFIQFAIAKEHMEMAAKFGNPPARISVLSGDLRKTYPSFGAQLASLKQARPRPRTPCWREVERKVGDALSQWEVAGADVIGGLQRSLAETWERDQKNGCSQ